MIGNWNVTKEDAITISAIVHRAHKLAEKNGKEFDHLNLVMDITACHLHGCPLKLKELLIAPQFDFSHDVFGIACHIDRETGKLTNCFLPRYAKPSTLTRRNHCLNLSTP